MTVSSVVLAVPTTAAALAPAVSPGGNFTLSVWFYSLSVSHS
ncbi:hypothetical protein [Actinoplanes sp. NPDC051494]